MREWVAFVRQILLAWICNVIQTSMISSFTVQTNHPGSCYKADFGGSGWGPRVYISDKLPGNVSLAGPQTSLWAPKIKWESEKDSRLLQSQTSMRHRIWSHLTPALCCQSEVQPPTLAIQDSGQPDQHACAATTTFNFSQTWAGCPAHFLAFFTASPSAYIVLLPSPATCWSSAYLWSIPLQSLSRQVVASHGCL